MLYYLKSLLFIEGLLVIGIVLFRAALRPDNRVIIGPKAIGLTLITPAVALLCGNIFIFYLYLVGAVAVTSRTRAELCATYLMLLPMTPALTMAASTGTMYLVQMSTILAMNFGALVGFVFIRPKRITTSPLLDVGAVLLVALFVYIDSRNVSVTSIIRTCIIYFVQLGVPYLVMSRGISNRGDINRLFVRFAYAGTLCAVVAVFDASRHWILYQSFNDALHLPLTLGSATMNIRGGLLRTGGMMLDYTAAGIFFATNLVAMPGLWSQFRRGWSPLVCFALLGGLLATQSRGAWVATGVGLATIMIYRCYTGRGIALLTAAAAVETALATILAPTSKLAETFGAGGAGAQTGEYRKQLLSSGIHQIAMHPLFGQPPKQLVANMPELNQGQHIVDFVNTHLYVALAAGLPWLLLWLLLWAAPLVLAWRNRTARQDRAIFDPAETPMAIIVTTMIAVIFTSTIDRNLYWPTIALGLMGPCLVMRQFTKQSYYQSRPTPLIGIHMGGRGQPQSSATI